MSHILGIKFRPHGQVYFFDSGAFVVTTGDHVIVKTDQGMGLGEVAAVRTEPPDEASGLEFKTIYRLATEEDMAVKAENEERSREAFQFCRRCISKRELEMKLVDVEIFFDRSKMIFYFTAPGRIDFRELVKDLVKTYRTRIELRQIGVRHETQMLGAVGNCGQVACCRRFMRKFVPVTIKMAKEQNLFLNPAKISGICGRLLCCLSFEEANYREFYKRCPKIGKRLDTDDGPVKVIRANFFRGTLSLINEVGEEIEVNLDEWEALNPRRIDPHAPARPRPPRDGGPRPSRRPARQGKPSGGQARPGESARKGGDKGGEKGGDKVGEAGESRSRKPKSKGKAEDARARKKPRPRRRKKRPVKKSSPDGKTSQEK